MLTIDEELKRQLAAEVCAILEGWTIGQCVARYAIRPSRVSELRHGRLASISLRRLVRLIAKLDYDIEVSLRPKKREIRRLVRPTATVVRYDQFGRRADQGAS